MSTASAPGPADDKDADQPTAEQLAELVKLAQNVSYSAPERETFVAERSARARAFKRGAVRRLAAIEVDLVEIVASEAFRRARLRGADVEVTTEDVNEAYLDLVEPKSSPLADPLTVLGGSVAIAGLGALASVFASHGSDPNAVVVYASVIGLVVGSVMAAFGFGQARGRARARGRRLTARSDT